MKYIILTLSLSLLLACTQKTSEEHLASARDYLEQENTDAAVVELKNAVKLEPQSAEARFELGKVYLSQKKFENAEKELNRALDYGYPAAEVIPLLSSAYKRTGAYAALSEIDHTLEGLSGAEQAEVGFYKLQSLVQLDKREDAQALLDEIETLDTRSVYKGLALVFRSLLDNEIDAALAQMEELKAQAPRNGDVLRLQAQLYMQTNQIDKAIETYSTYLDINQDDLQTKFLLAKLLVENRQMEQATPYLDELLEQNSEHPLLNQLKATALAAMNEHEQALEHAEKAIRSGNTAPELRLVAGFSAYQQRDFEAAINHLTYIASSLPDNHPALKMLAASQLQLGQANEASDILSRVDASTKADAALFSKTGYELLRSGNIKEAEKVITKSETVTKDAEDLTRLGLLQLSMNNLEGILNLEQAVAQAPELTSAKSTLATAYLATQQWDKALALAAEWKQTAPADPAPYMLVADVRIKQEQYDEARDELDKALQIEPGFPMAKLALARIDASTGKMAKAIADIGQLIDQTPQFIAGLASYYQLVSSEKGETEKAMAPALKALKNAPDNKQLKLLVSRMQLAQGEEQAALDALEGIEPTESAPKSYWALRGQALLQANQRAQADDHFDAWLAVAPNEKQAVLGKLLLLDNQNQFGEAIELAEGFLEVRNDLQVELLLAHFLTLSGEFERAREIYADLPEESKSMPLMKATQARLLTSEKKFSDALPLGMEAYREMPNTRNLIFVVALLEKQGRRDDALTLLEDHAEQNPQDNAALMLLAERNLPTDKARATALYERILKNSPDNFVVLNNLAFLYYQEGRLGDAKPYAQRAVQLRPENDAALDTLAQILMAEENYDEAVSYYERAATNEIPNEEIYLNYVEALLKNNQKRLAARKLASREFNDENLQARAQQLKTEYGI